MFFIGKQHPTLINCWSIPFLIYPPNYVCFADGNQWNEIFPKSKSWQISLMFNKAMRSTYILIIVPLIIIGGGVVADNTNETPVLAHSSDEQPHQRCKFWFRKYRCLVINQSYSDILQLGPQGSWHQRIRGSSTASRSADTPSNRSIRSLPGWLVEIFGLVLLHRNRITWIRKSRTKVPR